MSNTVYIDLLYCSIAVLASACGAARYKEFDTATKIFAVYIIVATISEITAFLCGKFLHDNMPVYAVYNLLEFVFVSMFFNRSIDVFYKRNVGYYIAVIGLFVGIINIVCIQGIHSLNSYFLFFEGVVIIAMALLLFFRLLINNNHLQLYRSPHFWLATVLVFFWSITMLNWSMYDYFLANHKELLVFVNTSIVVVGIVTYVAIGCIFILYPKMSKSYAG